MFTLFVVAMLALLIIAAHAIVGNWEHTDTDVLALVFTAIAYTWDPVTFAGMLIFSIAYCIGVRKIEQAAADDADLDARLRQPRPAPLERRESR